MIQKNKGVPVDREEYNGSVEEDQRGEEREEGCEKASVQSSEDSLACPTVARAVAPSATTAIHFQKSIINVHANNER